MMRATLLYLSEQRWLRHWVETSSVTGKVTSRFVAGESLEQGLAVARRLRDEKTLVTLDYLGENVHSIEEARTSRDVYLRSLDGLNGMCPEATVSIKLSQFGLELSPAACRENVAQLVERAAAAGSRVEIDMEGSAHTERTLDVVREMHGRFRAVRAVIQAYLYRSEADIRSLGAEGIPVRLCKGAYKEPPSVAFAKKAEVDANYVRLMKQMLDSGTYPAIASHDEAILNEALRYVRERGYGAERFEFQMLYGIRRDLQKMLVQKGFRLRLYVPYGNAWYPYFMRRLAERPANVLFLARNLLRN